MRQERCRNQTPPEEAGRSRYLPASLSSSAFRDGDGVESALIYSNNRYATPPPSGSTEPFSTRTHAFAVRPSSPRKARKTEGYFTSHRDVFGRPLTRDSAALSDGKRLAEAERNGKRDPPKTDQDFPRGNEERLKAKVGGEGGTSNVEL